MNRRHLLALVGTTATLSSTGCTGRFPRLRDNDQRRISVTEYTSTVSEPPLSISLEVSSERIGPEQPAYLSILVQNTDDDPVTTSVPWYKGFNDGTLNEDHNLAIWSTDAPNAPTPDEALNCFHEDWEGEEEIQTGLGHGVGTDEGAPRHTLDPEQYGRSEHIIGANRMRNRCFPAGTYRFTNDIPYYHSDHPEGDDDYDFEFIIEIE